MYTSCWAVFLWNISKAKMNSIWMSLQLMCTVVRKFLIVSVDVLLLFFLLSFNKKRKFVLIIEPKINEHAIYFGFFHEKKGLKVWTFWGVRHVVHLGKNQTSFCHVSLDLCNSVFCCRCCSRHNFVLMMSFWTTEAIKRSLEKQLGRIFSFCENILFEKNSNRICRDT